MKRVLVIAYYFPPIGGIGSIRMASMVEHLPEFGWDPVVIAPLRTPHASDPRLDVHAGRVIRTRSLELSRLGTTLPEPRSTGDGEAHGDGVRERIRSLARGVAHRYLYFPDAQVGWFPSAVMAGRRVMSGVDAIYSSSFPVTAHLVARSLARRSSVPWVAEWRDPWSDALPADHPYRSRAGALEQSIATAAAGVVMPTPTWAAHYGARWGKEIATVPNGYDDNLASTPVDRHVSGRPLLTHLGNYYPGRQSFASLWKALAELVTADPGSAPQVRFVGELAAAGRSEMEAAGIAHLVEELGFVPHEEALRLIGESTALIAAGATGSGPVDRGWIPAKLFEYLATGLPVLYSGDPAGDAAALLASQPGCEVVAPGDSGAMRAALSRVLEGSRQPRDLSGLTRRERARQLGQVLTDATRS